MTFGDGLVLSSLVNTGSESIVKPQQTPNSNSTLFTLQQTMHKLHAEAQTCRGTYLVHSWHFIKKVL